MKILITGATGNVGNHLGRALVKMGHELIVVSRSKIKTVHELEFPAHVIEHDLTQSPLQEKDVDGVEAYIHLMGESIDGRWTEDKKKRILDSRQKSSENLVRGLPTSLKTIISASAQGIYGDQGRNWVNEQSQLGHDFLANVCRAWEAPFQNISNVRTVQLRISLVLDSQFGALKKMIPLFQRGLGGVLGDGQQYMSWISVDDLTNIIIQAVQDTRYSGAINCSTEHPVTNQEWTQLLRNELQALPSPAVPKLALKIALGKMADVVTTSTRLRPEKLISYGFVFKYSQLQDYFKNVLVPYHQGCHFFSTRQYIAQPVDKVFSFFAEAKNLESITPPFLKFTIENMSTDQIQKGTLIDYRLKIKGVPVKWKTLIAEWNPPHQFVDSQLQGPYKLWHHTHQFESLGTGTLISDHVRYQLPLGLLGRLTASAFVQNDVEKIFRFRREVIQQMTF